MRDKIYPTWIEWLFNSGVGLNCFEGSHAPFRQEKNRETVQQLAESDANGLAELRLASLEELGSEDVRRIERAIFYLMTCGQAADVAKLERLYKHHDEVVKKGAKTCVFELRRLPLN